jgi:cold shock CspA family protein
MKLLIAILLVGHIHWYDPQRGVGFIKWSHGVVVFHYSDVIGNKKLKLKRGTKVRFTVKKDKPNVAKKVKVLK